MLTLFEIKNRIRLFRVRFLYAAGNNYTVLFPAEKSSKEGSARARYFQNNVAQPVALTDKGRGRPASLPFARTSPTCCSLIASAPYFAKPCPMQSSAAWKGCCVRARHYRNGVAQPVVLTGKGKGRGGSFFVKTSTIFCSLFASAPYFAKLCPRKNSVAWKALICFFFLIHWA